MRGFSLKDVLLYNFTLFRKTNKVIPWEILFITKLNIMILLFLSML